MSTGTFTGNGRQIARYVFDSSLAIGLLGLAFWTGGQAQQVREVQQKLVTRGAVAISMEADARLTSLEEKWRQLQTQLERIEKKLDALNGERPN